MMAEPSRLRAQCLNFWEVLAQAIALISPTMTAVLIVPLMFATTGNASWLAYAFGTIMLLFVAFNLNQFAKRSSHTGSMFLYTQAGLGSTAGGLSGWCLIWAYLFIGTAGLTGFTIFAQQLLGMAGLHVPAVPLFAFCALISWVLAYRDIALSTIFMLVIESVSVAVILLLAFIAIGHHGTGTIDADQLVLKGNSLTSLGLGVVVAIFSLVGFECATAFGDEAKDPLKTIPRAVVVSLLLTGVFFVFISYIEIMALRTSNPSLDKLTTPLSTLATMLHVDILQIPIDAGAMISFFSLALSCMNAGARVVYQMGRQGFFHASTGRSHSSHETPHIAVTVIALIQFAIPTILTTAFGLGVSDAFGDAGTFGAFGFLGAYVLVSIAAPMYLRKLGELRPIDVVWSAVALVCLVVPAVGSVYPVPAAPVNLFPYIFAAYVAIGIVIFVARRKSAKKPASLVLSEADLELAS
jgi:amino acid transporter